MLDIHTHLYWKSYDADRDEVVRRAHDAGVEKMICVGTTIDESRQAIEIAERYESVYASVGLHPHFFNETKKEISNSQREELRKLAKHQKVIAIGECGLDYFVHNEQRTVSNKQKEIQKEGFLKQLELAKELQLPLIIHCRDAYQDVYSILKSKIENLKSAVLHCYMGDTEVTKKFLELPNVYFSFAGNITYPVKKSALGTKDDLTETVKLIPFERLFVETDCPFLSPQEKRGERNEPSYALFTAEKVSKLKSVARPELDRILKANFSSVFGWMAT